MAEEDRDVTITISAKNLTEKEFKKVQAGLAGVDKSVDKTDKKTSGLQSTFQAFGKAAPGALKAVAAGAVAAGAVIGGLALAVFKLGERGTELGAIQESFGSLTAAVGESGAAMIAMTQTATKGLVSDLDIMAAANKGLLLGLPLTESSMGELSASAIILGKAMGQDAAKSLDDLITALGRSSPLILDNLGLTVKVGDANKTYAEKIGKTVGQLTEAEKKTAFYEAALEAARVKTEQLGGIQLTFGDHVTRATTLFANFTDSLSIMTANSPVLMAAVGAAGDALAKAFGGDKQELVLGVVNVIERAALTAIEFGLSGIEAAGVFSRGFAGIKVMVLGAAAAFVTVEQKVASFLAGTLELHAAIPGVGLAFKGQAIAARAAADSIGGVSESLKAQVAEAAIAAAGNDAFGRALDTASVALGTIKESMINAGLSQQVLNQEVAIGIQSNAGLGTSLEGLGVQLEELDPTIVAWQDSLIETSATTQTFQEDSTAAFTATGAAAVGYGVRLDALGALTQHNTKVMTGAFKFFGLQTNAQMAETEKKAKEAFEEILASGEFTAEELEKIWAKYEESRQTDQASTEKFTLTSNEAIMQGSSAIFNELGKKNKSAAIAGAIISTLQGIAKAHASAPWPASLVLMAGAAAAGFANVAAIRGSSAFQEGTSRLDFQNFGTQSMAALHGMEAIIPQGAGHALGREVASELATMRQPQRDTSTELAAELRESFAALRGLPIAIQRAVRDGIMLAG